MKTPGMEFIRNEMDWDSGDAWGSVMSAQFDIAEAWWHASGLCVAQYRPSQVMVQGDFEEGSRVERLVGGIFSGIISIKDIWYWLKVLERTQELVVKAGRAY